MLFIYIYTYLKIICKYNIYIYIYICKYIAHTSNHHVDLACSAADIFAVTKPSLDGPASETKTGQQLCFARRMRERGWAWDCWSPAN